MKTYTYYHDQPHTPGWAYTQLGPFINGLIKAVYEEEKTVRIEMQPGDGTYYEFVLTFDDRIGECMIGDLRNNWYGGIYPNRPHPNGHTQQIIQSLLQSISDGKPVGLLYDLNQIRKMT